MEECPTSLSRLEKQGNIPRIRVVPWRWEYWSRIGLMEGFRGRVYVCVPPNPKTYLKTITCLSDIVVRTLVDISRRSEKVVLDGRNRYTILVFRTSVRPLKRSTRGAEMRSSRLLLTLCDTRPFLFLVSGTW